MKIAFNVIKNKNFSYRRKTNPIKKEKDIILRCLPETQKNQKVEFHNAEINFAEWRMAQFHSVKFHFAETPKRRISKGGISFGRKISL
jgi:hypothetical protein